MALPQAYPRERAKPQSGMLNVALIPGDTGFEVQLQRAVDDGTGAPNVGTAEIIARLPPMANTGVVHQDLLPLDGVKRFYRYRHVRDLWTDGAWSLWSVGLAPRPGTIIPQMAIGVSDYTRFLDSVATVSNQHLGPRVADVFGNVIPGDLLYNGDFEEEFAYWTTLQGSPASIITSGPLVGARSLRIPVVTSGTMTIVQQCVDGRTVDGASPELLLRVMPGWQLLLMATGKLSSAGLGVSCGLRLREYGADRSNLTDVGGAAWTTETVATPKRTLHKLGGSTRYVGIRVVQAAAAGSAGTFDIDEIHAFLWPVNATLNEFDIGTKGTAFDVDFDNGANQSVLLTASVTATLKQPLRGGIYTLHVKQDGTGGRVLTLAGDGGASINWPSGTTPTWSGANKVDSITLFYSTLYNAWRVIVSGANFNT